MNASRLWFRFYSESVDDEKLRLLAFEDRWHFVALLCCKARGILDAGDAHELLRRKLCVKLGVHDRELGEIARRLGEVGLIDAETFQPIAWNARQRESDTDSTNAERQRRFRESQKAKSAQVVDGEGNALRNVTSNGVVTRPETETETETEEDQKTSNPNGLLVETRDASSDDPPPTDTPDATPAADRCPVRAIVALYHTELPMLPKCTKVTVARAAAIRQRWREDLHTLDDWREYFADVRASPFLTGHVRAREGRAPFRASLPWLVKAENFAKVSEGKYHEGQP